MRLATARGYIRITDEIRGWLVVKRYLPVKFQVDSYWEPIIPAMKRQGESLTGAGT